MVIKLLFKYFYNITEKQYKMKNQNSRYGYFNML